ncbi:cytochrome o ubiquinol oxidase subunit 3 [Ochrobactrum daejeonense]|uniref:Cytochrome bo(3) ubiquinol oxidase subunit 3 n=1 Tax=Brucella daejeonensis TaxID=659015 RepID=A0A7W9ATI6_9HYPH|nr:cytochrome o ubiquinol oxidase subunit III [Brucella daejeonensis]MBB5700315.1 cytochrome o ubiquinol oxidase subunit 3 [Brucella daejeonensis]NKB78466.1 cytochrome o ubiquinol oxidase subunit III [Brucella daejeonensis]
MSAHISNAAPFLGGNAQPAHEDHHDAGSTTLVGFWIYLMSDCVLFSGLFATYAVLAHQFAGGPTGRELFDLNFVLIETMLLLVSSLTYGLATLSMFKKNRTGLLFWLGITFLLGAGFLGMEIYEFSHLIHEEAGPGRSAFLSAFFTLVGTHGLHITSGLIWIVVLTAQLLRDGLTEKNQTRVMCLSLFWHFLDIIWIGVFTLVYLLGVL